MKNAFYSTLKAFFVFKRFKFLSCGKNGSIIKIRLISKSTQPGEETIAIHILPNISRTKGIQAMRFAQLIEYNTRNIFVEKSYTKCAGENILRPLSKKSKLSISLDQQFFSIVCKFEGYKIQLNQAADHLLLPNISFFKKEKDWYQFPCLIFSWGFLLTDQISLSG